MSTAIAKNFQVGSDSTATNNFTIRQPATPDGTVRIANGNSGTTTDLVTVTSAGNVGVGTSSPGAKLQVQSGTLTNPTWAASDVVIAGNSTGNSTFYQVLSDTAGGLVFSTPTTRARSLLIWNEVTGNMSLTNGSSGSIIFTNNGSERMRLDSSGNVGIGTSSPGAKLEIGALGVFRMQTGSTVFNTTPTAGAVDTLVWNTSNAGSGFAWNTNSAERVRITPGGDLLVGTTSGLNGSRFYSVTTGNAISGGFKNDTAGYQTIQVWNAAASGTRNLIQFNAGTGGTNVGLVTSDGTNTTYGTSSDYRLKENIQPMIGALEKVAQLKPCIYTWKATGAAGQGFIAHELQNVVPDAVVGEKDAVNEDGSIRPQNIDTSFLVATLTAAIQELKAELDSVKTELALLKGTA